MSCYLEQENLSLLHKKKRLREREGAVTVGVSAEGKGGAVTKQDDSKKISFFLNISAEHALCLHSEDVVYTAHC
jgi:hypothetical protein